MNEEQAERMRQIGYEAAQSGKGRNCPLKAKQLVEPEMIDVYQALWLEGYDRQKAERPEGELT